MSVVAEVAASAAKKNFVLVTHDNPDTDAYACLWAAQRFVVGNDPSRIVFMANERLTPQEVGDAEVLYMDCGGGPLDQHGKELERASSFELVCEHFGLVGDPGIEAILEMTRKADNDEKIPSTDLHHILGGLRKQYTSEDKEVDWDTACAMAFVLLDIAYTQACARFKAVEEFERNKGRLLHTLENGLRVAVLFDRVRLKEAARNVGADIVIFTQKMRLSHRITCGIQVGREVKLTLEQVMSGLRAGEARRREIPLEEWGSQDLHALGENPMFGGWYLHDSRRLIVCGTPKHELGDEGFTRLNPREIVDIVKARLSQVKYVRA